MAIHIRQIELANHAMGAVGSSPCVPPSRLFVVVNQLHHLPQNCRHYLCASDTSPCDGSRIRAYSPDVCPSYTASDTNHDSWNTLVDLLAFGEPQPSSHTRFPKYSLSAPGPPRFPSHLTTFSHPYSPAHLHRAYLGTTNYLDRSFILRRNWIILSNGGFATPSWHSYAWLESG